MHILYLNSKYFRRNDPHESIIRYEVGLSANNVKDVVNVITVNEQIEASTNAGS